MSTGMVAIEMPPTMAISRAMTTNVYGRRSASLTIHMVHSRTRPGYHFSLCEKRPAAGAGNCLPAGAGGIRRPASCRLSVDVQSGRCRRDARLISQADDVKISRRQGTERRVQDTVVPPRVVRAADVHVR